MLMLLDKVKDKKEFRGLSDDFVSRVLAQVTAKHDAHDPKQQTAIIKEARSRLRDLHSAFRTPGYHRKAKYLQKMHSWDDKELCSKILALHISTKERLPHYPALYKKIHEFVPFRTVLDLGCGMNVFSLPWMGKVHYYGIDVNRDDTEFCNSYLSKFKLDGAVRWGDLMSFDKFVKCDVTFVFKVLEGLESLQRGAAEDLLDKIPSRHIVCSFATKSLGGRKNISEKRLKWFEELEPVAEKFKFGTEVYYLIKR